MKEEIRQHKFTCDRCGRTETTNDRENEVAKNIITYPKGWKSLGETDLCDRCGAGFDEFMDGGEALLRGIMEGK